MITHNQKIEQSDIEELIAVFYRQIKLQEKIKYGSNREPIVDVYNSATSAIIEIVEMLQENTSWKKYITGSKKEPHIDTDAFLEEYCDVLLYIMNIAIYADIDIENIIYKLSSKQKQNFERFKIYD